ncbi:MAG: T9SS type A sorting domain-containing protein [Bacteroidales bacterium]|jgi:hypothetical protein
MKKNIHFSFCVLFLLLLFHKTFSQTIDYNYPLLQKRQADYVSQIKGELLYSNVSITCKPNNLKPFSAEDISILIPQSETMLKGLVVKEGVFAVPGGRFIRYLISSYLPGQTFNFTIGGLEPDKSYNFEFRLEDRDGSRFQEKITFRTEPAPIVNNKSLLFVIDKDLENDPDILNSINQYIADANKLYPDLSFKNYYLADNNRARADLYDTINQLYYNNNLSYLFFIGRNALIEYTSYYYDEYNDTTYQYQYSRMDYYTYIYNQGILYNSLNDSFCEYRNIDSISIVDDCRSQEISFGVIAPTQFDLQNKKAYVLSYFDKLHQFRSGNISFSNSVLYSMTMKPEDDSLVLDKLKLIKRFENNQQIAASHVYGGSYQNDDVVWREDYLNKLNTNSYEMCMLNVHGAPLFHQFGITPTEIISLSNLNVLFFLLVSCSNGNMLYEHFLAGEYLDKGNTLAVLAFNEVVSWVGDTFDYLLSENNLGNYIYRSAKGEIISDAIKHTGSNSPLLMFFGDPLMSFNYNNLNVSIAMISGEQGMLTALTTQPGQYNYQWLLNGSLIPGANSEKLLPVCNGTYKVMVSGNNCFAESDSLYYNQVVTGIRNNSESQFIKVYPNPTTGPLKIEGLNNDEKNDIQVFSIDGLLLMEKSTFSSTHLLDLSNLSQGVYILIINKSFIQKVVKL